MEPNAGVGLSKNYLSTKEHLAGTSWRDQSIRQKPNKHVLIFAMITISNFNRRFKKWESNYF